MRPVIDKSKVANLSTANEMLDEKYGKTGTPARDAFEAKAKAWYYAEVLKDARKAAGMTQQKLADRIGKKREYIASLEKGETDMQLSTFIMISQAVGLQVSLTH
jgi:DNA-binding XRE family transcriptional regulator